MTQTKPSQIYAEDSSLATEKVNTPLLKPSSSSLELSHSLAHSEELQVPFDVQGLGVVIPGDGSPHSQEQWQDLTSSEATISLDDHMTDCLTLPVNTQRFLTGVEHPLSENELKSFQLLSTMHHTKPGSC